MLSRQSSALVLTRPILVSHEVIDILWKSPDRSGVLSDLERTCVTFLNDHNVAKDTEEPPNPVSGTCQWIRSHHLFVSWLKKGNNAFLWLTGHPGSGKTIMSWSLHKYFDDAHVRSCNVITYFCQNKNKQTDGRAVLIGLILQVINLHRSMVRHVRLVFEMQGSSMIQSFSSLWRIFLRIVRDPKVGTLYIILDALDECEKTSCNQLLESISDMLSDSFQPMRSGAAVKFLITSRPLLHDSYVNTKKALQPRISIDEDQTGYTEDLQLFIRERVDEISFSRQYSSDMRDFLYQTITSKADRTFLWIHIVLESIEKSLLNSKNDFHKIMASIPEGLVAIYQRYLSALPPDHQDEASHLLKLLLASARSLNLDELNIAFTISNSHSTTEHVMRDTQNAMAHTVQGILGPLVRLSRQPESSKHHVSLVHQSLKDFLLEEVAAKDDSFTAMRTVNAQSSALRLATVCIQYLLLDDFDIDFFSREDSTAGSGLEMPHLLNELPAGDFSGNFWDQDDHLLNSDMLFGEPDALYPDICRSLRSKYAFYDYASLHWAEHFAICEEAASNDLRIAAKSLLDVHTASCRNWLHFYCMQAATPIDGIIDQEPIVLASQFNSLTVLNDLLESCVPSQANKNRSLYWASRLGHDRIVAALLSAGAEPNSRELERETALTTASEHGNLACVVKLLANERTDPNMPGRAGRNALSFSCGSGHDNIVKELLSRSDCNADDPDNSGGTPFFWAVGGGHDSIIAALARQRNVDINHRDRTGRTAISWAAGDGMADTLISLLRLKGIDVNMKDNKGRSPLSWAAGNGHANAVEVLLKSTMVDRASVDHDERGAISWASGGGHYDVLVKLLDEECPGVDTEDIDGWTPLAWAIQTDGPEIVQALINNDQVEIERRDRGGRAALSWAVEYGHKKVVKVLLQAGADPWAKSNCGNTPVTTAKQFCRNDLVTELLSYRA